MDLRAEGGVAQGMVLASLIGGFALSVVAQLVGSFPQDAGVRQTGPFGRAMTALALAAVVMMANVWAGIVFFLDEGNDRAFLAVVFYAGLFVGVALAGVGMAEMVAIRAPRLRRFVLAVLAALLLAEIGLGLAVLR